MARAVEINRGITQSSASRVSPQMGGESSEDRGSDVTPSDKGVSNVEGAEIHQSKKGRQELIEEKRDAMGDRPPSPLGDSSLSGATTNAPMVVLGKDPMVETRGEEDESDEEDQDIEMPDLMVKTAAYGVGIANQSLKNAIDARAHHYQSKERVVNLPPNEEGWVRVGKGKKVLAEEASESPALDMPSSSNLNICEVMEQGLGEKKLVAQGEVKETGLTQADHRAEKLTENNKGLDSASEESGAPLPAHFSDIGVPQDSGKATSNPVSDSGSVEGLDHAPEDNSVSLSDFKNCRDSGKASLNPVSDSGSDGELPASGSRLLDGLGLILLLLVFLIIIAALLFVQAPSDSDVGRSGGLLLLPLLILMESRKCFMMEDKCTLDSDNRNILRDDSGYLKVADFGVSKLLNLTSC
ncbi:hypothetical protein U1Q18_005573 [Sarracenia purpurea var. burkii]